MGRLVVQQIGQIGQRPPPQLNGITLMRWISSFLHIDCVLIDFNSPPTRCNLDYHNDCPSKGGCVISAITNQTNILHQCLSHNDVSKVCADALKFLVHFIGDITQPLHCSNKSRGGNDIEVHFGNRRRNLHSVWAHWL
jgi:hypothetical protein